MDENVEEPILRRRRRPVVPEEEGEEQRQQAGLEAAAADNEQERRQQEQQALEQLLLEQQQQEDETAAAAEEDQAEEEQDHHRLTSFSVSSLFLLSYTSTSWLAMLGMIVYAYRSRQNQWYLAAVYLNNSKVAWLLVANVIMVTCRAIFDGTTSLFFQGGLRLQEVERVVEYFRWNVTETCFAMTLFRSQLRPIHGVQCLILMLLKCLHHVTALREQHVRMTLSVVEAHPALPWWFPVVTKAHIKLLILLFLLQAVDVAILFSSLQTWNGSQSGDDSKSRGGSGIALFLAFEYAILLVTAWSHVLLWLVHVVDCALQHLHEQQQERQQQQQAVAAETEGETETTGEEEEAAASQRDRHRPSWTVMVHLWWKEYKATVTFAIELQTQALQFVFYLTFFAMVLTYYGMPMNLFREVYISFVNLKERVMAFLQYRQLMAGMNQFRTVTDADELEQAAAGRICIICRDEMSTRSNKQLPICQHVFHTSCLREWLVQQQSCPICRSDIASMQAQEAARNAAAAAAEAAQEAVRNAAAAAAAAHEQRQRDGNEALLDFQRLHEIPQPQVGGEQEIVQPQEAGGAGGVSEPAREAETQAVPSLQPEAGPEESKPVVSAPTKQQPMDGAPLPSLTFPALYKVVLEKGATVWEESSFDEMNENGHMTLGVLADSKVQRIIPFGMAVLCLDLKELRFVEEGTGNMAAIVAYKVPDGWISEDSLLRVGALSPQKGK